MREILSFLYNPSLSESSALCLDDTYFSYSQLRERVFLIARHIDAHQLRNSMIGIYVSDHIDTYASILAVWITGNAYVPLHPSYPSGRIESIREMADLKLVLSTIEDVPGISDKPVTTNTTRLSIEGLPPTYPLIERSQNDLAYILFTSGSTGVPKGVRINWGNLQSFLRHVDSMHLGLPEQARYLQMFEFTFDLSVVSILLPLIHGGTIYHVSSTRVKYLEIYRLLEEYEIHFAIIVPSVLAMLRPYFDSILLPNLRVMALSGEAVPLGLTQAWQVCCPNAQFYNFYGPTECTIFCTVYKIPRTEIKSHNGIVCIGSPTIDSKAQLRDESGILTSSNLKGDLWIGGAQTSPGYIHIEELNARLFLEFEGIRYYNTGDIVIQDDDGDLFYLGRKDHQIKLNGYRVELSEVEYQAEQHLKLKTAAIVSTDQKGIHHLILYVEGTEIDSETIRAQLQKALPKYMLPETILLMQAFPLNQNGKLDRNQLRSLYESNSPQ